MSSVVVSSPGGGGDSFSLQQQPQDKLVLAPLQPSTVLYTMASAAQPIIKQEPVEAEGYAFPRGLHLDQGGQLGYSASALNSSEALPATQASAISAVSSSSAEPGHYTTLSVNSSLGAQTVQTHHHLLSSNYSDHNALPHHHAHVHSSTPTSLNGNFLSIAEGKVGAAGMSDMVRVMCGEMEAEEKELAKLQTVRMDEDMSDL